MPCTHCAICFCLLTALVAVPAGAASQDSLPLASAWRPRGRIVIDGILDSSEGWPDSVSLTIACGDNRCDVVCGHNDDGLLVAARVFDTSVMTACAPDSARELGWRTQPWPLSDAAADSLQYGDCIAFFFDPDGSRDSTTGTDDCLLYVAPSGAARAYRIAPRLSVCYNWAPELVWSAAPLPDGYTVECFVPWTAFGLDIPPQHPIGFDVRMVDRDRRDTAPLFAQWAAPPRATLSPRAWGTLHLILPRQLHWMVLAAIGVCLTAMAAAVGWMLLRMRPPGEG